MLEIKNATCGYRKGKNEKIVINGMSMSVSKGEMMCVIGANGIGKTTLFRSILGGIPLLGGSIMIDGENMVGMSIRERARRIGYVPQSHTPPFPFTAIQITVMGRTSYMKKFGTPSELDYEISCAALKQMGILHLKDEPYTEISGGERQLVLIARAIAQESDYLIMDEPTSNLDFGNRIRVLNSVSGLAKAGRGIIMTTHDPDHAFMAADKVTAIKVGGEYVTGPTDEVLTCELMDEIYGINTGVAEVTFTGNRKVKAVVGYI